MKPFASSLDRLTPPSPCGEGGQTLHYKVFHLIAEILTGQ